MMKRLALSAALFVAAAFMPSAASAYCCWNKAICIAACGEPCCEKGSWGNLTSGQQSSLSAFSASDLQKEIDQCREAPPFQKVLRDEVKSRRTGAQPTGMRAIQATPERKSR